MSSHDPLHSGFTLVVSNCSLTKPPKRGKHGLLHLPQPVLYITTSLQAFAQCHLQHKHINILNIMLFYFINPCYLVHVLLDNLSSVFCFQDGKTNRSFIIYNVCVHFDHFIPIWKGTMRKEKMAYFGVQ